MAQDISSSPQSLSSATVDRRLRLRHFSIVVALVVVGAMLRFWQLDSKALWLDEVIGAIFSVGHNLSDVPLNQFFDFSALDQVFRLNTKATCGDITRSVATDSVHPPLYFCLAHRWLMLWRPDTAHWVWVLRSLPALIGVACIPVMYGLNRVLISPQAGLAGAALMAMSPFAVYLSQEARHYTLPMLLTLLTLLGLAKMLHPILRDRPIPWPWLLMWAVLSSVGLYVHYFYILVVVAQAIAIIAILIGLTHVPSLSSSLGTTASDPANRSSVHAVLASPKRIRHHSIRLSLAITVVVVSYLPWLPTLLSHFSRPETDWLKPYNPDWSDRLAPLYQTLSNVLLMVVAFPVEAQPWAISGVSALTMLIIGGWILYQAVIGFKRQWIANPPQRPQLLLLLTFVGGVLLEFFAITYILDKDVTSVPRYAFVYYPGMAALMGIGLTQRLHERVDRTMTIALLAGIISSALVVHGWVFHKGYYPRTVAQDLTFEGDRPVMLAVSYQSLQEVGLGLSFALEMRKQYIPEPAPSARIAFIHRPRGFGQVWRSLSDLNHNLPLPLNLWVVASPGMKTEDYPETLKLRRPNRNSRLNCTIDPEHFNRIGFPYQLFRCPHGR